MQKSLCRVLRKDLYKRLREENNLITSNFMQEIAFSIALFNYNYRASQSNTREDFCLQLQINIYTVPKFSGIVHCFTRNWTILPKIAASSKLFSWFNAYTIIICRKIKCRAQCFLKSDGKSLRTSDLKLSHVMNCRVKKLKNCSDILIFVKVMNKFVMKIAEKYAWHRTIS